MTPVAALALVAAPASRSAGSLDRAARARAPGLCLGALSSYSNQPGARMHLDAVASTSARRESAPACSTRLTTSWIVFTLEPGDGSSRKWGQRLRNQSALNARRPACIAPVSSSLPPSPMNQVWDASTWSRRVASMQIAGSGLAKPTSNENTAQSKREASEHRAQPATSSGRQLLITPRRRLRLRR